MIGDRLGVLSSTRYVVDHARHVHFDLERLLAVCRDVAASGVSVPEWNRELHWSDGEEQTAMYIFVLDSLNFCFWGEPRWTITYKNQVLDGYWALAASLRRAIEESVPILDAAYLAEMPEQDLAHVLRGTGTVPLFAERLRNLHDLGRWLVRKYNSQCGALVRSARGDVVSLVQRLVTEFSHFVVSESAAYNETSSFNDVAYYDGHLVRLYKRAQILVADLAASLDHKGLGAFANLHELTAFADYKLPQILRRFGILVYEPALAAKVDSRELIEAGSEEEVEIRAHTVWAVELMRQELARQGYNYMAYQLDWWLWEASQKLPADTKPYHRTRTIYY